MSRRYEKQTHIIHNAMDIHSYEHGIPVGLCFKCYAICLLPPTMHISVMPIGRGAISHRDCEVYYNEKPTHCLYYLFTRVAGMKMLN